jgi:hypothetical protein
VYFKDPFNEFNGLDKLNLIFSHMFKNLTNPHFVFIDIVESNDSSYLTWDFIFQVKGREMKIHGGSLLKWGEDGKVVYHRDYWDVGEELLMKIPMIKSIYKAFRNKLTVA